MVFTSAGGRRHLGQGKVRELFWALVGVTAACSPSVAMHQTGDEQNGSGGASGGSGSGTGSFGGSTDPGLITLNQAGKTGTGPDGSCAATATSAEQRVVETQV